MGPQFSRPLQSPTLSSSILPPPAHGSTCASSKTRSRRRKVAPSSPPPVPCPHFQFPVPSSLSKLVTGNLGQGTRDRELGGRELGGEGTGGSKLETGNLGQGSGDRELGAGDWDRELAGRELGAANWGQGTWDRELGTGNWGEGTGTGDRELGAGNWAELLTIVCGTSSHRSRPTGGSQTRLISNCVEPPCTVFCFQGTPNSSIRVAQKSS